MAAQQIAAGEQPSLQALAEQLGRSSRRRMPLLLLGLIAIVIGLAILTVQLDRERRDAQKAAAAARLETAKAQEARRKTEEAFNHSARTLSQAREALRAGDMTTLATVLRAGLIEAEIKAQSVQADPGRERSPIPRVVPTETPRTFDVAVSGTPYEQQVYIQFAGLIQRPDVASLNRALRAAGWNMQGRDGERTGKAAGLNEVRFSAEEDREAAKALAEALTRARIGSRPVSARQVEIIRPGTLEAWISNS